MVRGDRFGASHCRMALQWKAICPSQFTPFDVALYDQHSGRLCHAPEAQGTPPPHVFSPDDPGGENFRKTFFWHPPWRFQRIKFIRHRRSSGVSLANNEASEQHSFFERHPLHNLVWPRYDRRWELQDGKDTGMQQLQVDKTVLIHVLNLGVIRAIIGLEVYDIERTSIAIRQ